MRRRDAGSMPDEGSSSSTAFEPPMRAQPTESLRFIPPLSARERACALPSSPTSTAIAAAADAACAAAIRLSAP